MKFVPGFWSGESSRDQWMMCLVGGGTRKSFFTVSREQSSWQSNSGCKPRQSVTHFYEVHW